jgi:serine/threonine protein kinase
MANYDEVFLAIAIKNNILQRETAMDILRKFRQALENDLCKSIEEFVLNNNYLPKDKVDLLSSATKKFFKIESEQPKPTEPIPGYRITGKIGVGGTATVFAGQEIATNRPVAIKIMHPSKTKDQKALNDFLREAKLLTEFDHPNIVKGIRYGEVGGLYYLVLEFLDGVTVQDIMDEKGVIEEERAVHIILDVAKALDYIQSKGYIHRDVKPGNVMITKDNLVKLLDLGFSIPKGVFTEDQEFTVGTAEFISPEQAQGAKDIDIRSDIYSLGATLYYMVIGELPFKGETSLEIIAQHVLQSLNSAEIKNRNLSRLTHYFIERMMSKDKNLRYETPKDLIEDITANLEGYKRLVKELEETTTESTKTSVMEALSGTSPDAKSTTKMPTGRFATTRFKKLGFTTKRIQRNEKQKS